VSTSPLDLLNQLWAYVEESHPRSLRGLREAREIDPAYFEGLAAKFLRWAVTARGEDALPSIIDAFVYFSTDVNMAQARYELAGNYENKTFAECDAALYQAGGVMDDYLWGIYLTNFLWAHHLEITKLYEERYLPQVAPNANLVEIAPGHGGWGVLALDRLPEAKLTGYDISPSAMVIARSIAEAAGVGDRAKYEEKDALNLQEVPAEIADACVCGFVVEHLEDPQKLFRVIAHLLKPHGTAFITGALTAAQIDHIYEFRNESELVLMCEVEGLRVTDSLSVAPRRTLPNARYLPRSQALIVQKKAGEIW